MIPTTVGEIRKAIDGLPDDMLFDIEIKGPIQTLQDAKLEVGERYAGYDGTLSKPKYRKMLVLTLRVED